MWDAGCGMWGVAAGGMMWDALMYVRRGESSGILSASNNATSLRRLTAE